ncbi:pyruvate, phosphate dikinase [Candidatus Manganitrophus noduliformans]|uniref:Pyruvate, phosphate dikinase n=1 Tax=Candidatus Manganitrophus noduliformans TaxID=2606439 RepID=A0A7X6IAV8_9BACT|nr:pyruvate, phosphate dikinase [Candidatus Manganitrophus noduliformans]NKE71126.1 pyruvate, phosphate dikinase [Candidatus Manganitrophus noduliformans]
MATKKKYVYYFGDGRADGRGDMKDLLGGKGAGLAEMTRLGIPVPAGFTITTEACIEFFDNKKSYPKGMWEEALAALKRVEKSIGCGFGDPKSPLLVSVRSGAKASMPGMMDTVLNLGLNDQTVLGLIEKSKNERFGYDAYRRFISMFGSVVMGVKRDKFEKALEEKKLQLRARLDTDLPAEALKEMVQTYKKIVLNETGRNFPEDPIEQLRLGINAVFNSWFGQRAMTYRRLNNIPDTWGTAVSVVAMVFGNLGETSGTGVAFTRDPSTGERRFFGEFLFNAQGEDVVAGIRTPLPIDALKQKLPKAYRDLMAVYKKLEKHYKDMLDIEFTIQEGKLYMLQTRVGKRTAAAAMRIAVEMAKEKLITKETALLRIDPVQLDQLLHPMIDPKAKVRIIAKGLPASPGAAIGKVVFTAEEAQHMAERHERVILVRTETSPEDIGGMHAAEGIVTARGGMTSHAAVVARGMGKCCVAGCGALHIDEERKFFTVGDVTVKEGDYITLNGSTGEVILGQVDLIQPEMSGSFKTLMGWADAARKLNVRANADTPHDARVAREFGAEGIGLCRTEHMFFEGDRIKAVREMILADTLEGRKRALAKLLPMQKGDFIGIFREMKGLPVTIRLLDPPLHEFLPQTEEDLEELSREMGIHVDLLRAKNRSLHEFNPMLGHRGCRLGITFPEIYEMQAQAIFEAACELAQEKLKVIPEVMIPLVAHIKELSEMKALCVRTAEEVMARYKKKISYTIGTMIELPRAALVADQIAREAEFFSFGTNDLTQTTFGLSRDDAGRFLPDYVHKGILDQDPFVAIDQEGVGLLMKMGVEKGRSARPGMKIGICGEHGGEPSSVEFCHRIGLNYVSCSPFRVPIARLAAAQAMVRGKMKGKDGGHRATV